MKYLLYAIFLISKTAIAQNEGNVWYFGNNAGVTFNTSPPSALLDGRLYQREGCSSVCDASGALLFYTDGQRVYNKNHSIMPNGTGLLGNNSSCQSGVIIPWPDSSSKYFIITVDAIENAALNGMRYSVVDMRLNGGLGDIVLSQKNVTLMKVHCEKATAVQHCNKRDFWLIANNESSDSILAFPITPSGISKNSVKSNTGLNISGNLNNNLGYINASHDYTKLAACFFLLNKVLLMDFNNQTGKVSNPIVITKPSPYCAEFSPNNKVLYVSALRSPTSIDQFAIDVPSQSTIQASKKTIFDYGSGEMGALKLAPDGKIYVTSETIGYNTFLGAINFPNTVGAGCYFSAKEIYLGNRTARLGLPNVFYSKGVSHHAKITVEDTCLTDSTLFTLFKSNITAVKWDFGDKNSGSQNFATGAKVAHSFTQRGKYIVKAYYSTACENDSMSTTVNIVADTLYPELGIDTAICEGDSIILQPKLTYSSYSWTGGDTTSQKLIKKPGKYILRVRNECKEGADTIEVRDKGKNDLILLRDTLVCQSNIHIQLIAGCSSPHQTQWSTGETKDTIHVEAPGQYSVSVKNKCGTYLDTASVEQFNPNINIGSDTSICFTSPYKLSISDSEYLIQWSSGVKGPVCEVNASGKYWVDVSKDFCTISDTIIIGEFQGYTNLLLPNAFSPNNDNVNDNFPFTDKSFIYESLYIYNRWGEKIFEDTKSSDGWSGIYRGYLSQEGVYLYLITYKTCNGSLTRKNGTFTLIR